jgi:two-component system sensor histidine kinase KdpD
MFQPKTYKNAIVGLMTRMASTLLRTLACIMGMWAVAKTVFAFLPHQDAVAAMLLLLGVLAIATTGDRVLAGVSSLSASLSFSYYFVDSVGSRISPVEGLVTFLAMLITAMTGSQLSLRLHLRAAESDRRRSEMARLQELGAALLATDTVSQAAERATREIVRLFGGGAVLRVKGIALPFQAGVTDRSRGEPLVVQTLNRRGTLELYGMDPSAEVRSAQINLVGLVLDRAAAAEQRARVESVQRGEELRTTILNALAHSFRTPLTCIKAAASMLRNSEATAPDRGMPASCSRELVQVIDEEADRLDELIRDSLDLARIEWRQANPRMEDCSVAAVISAVVKKMERYLVRNPIILKVSSDLPLIRGDRFLFEQMFGQVLENARKYSGAGARIWISAQHSAEEVVLAIRNEGKQIPEEEQALIFDRFYRGVRNRAGIEGTGLGLAIARTIAEAHGGRIWLEQATEGPAFLFAIPAGGPEQEHDRESYCTAD